jgi:hypothetical protein
MRGSPIPTGTCDKPLADRGPCQLSKGHEGDCDPPDTAARIRVDAAHLVAAQNLRDFLHAHRSQT